MKSPIQADFIAKRTQTISRSGIQLAHTFSFESLTFCSALSVVSVTSKRLHGDYISTEHINHRVLARLAAVFL